MVPRLFLICRTQGCCSLFFSFWLEIPFMSKFGQKNQNCQFRQKLGAKTNLNMGNSMVISLFQFSTGNAFYRKIWSKKINCQFKLKFGSGDSPSVVRLGESPPDYLKSWFVPPYLFTVLAQKCGFCNFHTLFGRLA